MFYRLFEHYCLRGYTNNPFIIINKKDYSYVLLSRKEFCLLLLCDGEQDFNLLDFSDEEINLLDKLLSQKVIEKTDFTNPISDYQKYKKYNSRFMPYAQWSITPRCNFRCRHCFMDSPNTECKELSTREIFDIIDQLSECGFISVDLTGGDPLVRDDFWEIVDYLLSKDIGIGKIYTNGWLLSDEVIRNFNKRGINPAYSISFDGIGWHDWMRGVAGAEKKALDAIKLACSCGALVDVETCIFKGNLDVITDTIILLRECGVISIKFSSVMDSQLWSSNAEGNEISFKEYCDYVIANLEDYFTKCSGIHLMFSGVIDISSDRKNYSLIMDHGDCKDIINKMNLCGVFKTSVYISPDGRLCPCMTMHSAEDVSMFELISDTSLHKLLNDSSFNNYMRSHISDLYEKNSKCNSCEYKYNCCGGCRSKALLSGDKNLWGIDPDMCFLYKEGYLEKIKSAAESARII